MLVSSKAVVRNALRRSLRSTAPDALFVAQCDQALKLRVGKVDHLAAVSEEGIEGGEVGWKAVEGHGCGFFAIGAAFLSAARSLLSSRVHSAVISSCVSFSA